LGRGKSSDEGHARGEDGVDTDLAAKLNKLFEVMRKPSEPQLTNAGAAAAITKTTGVSTSPAYVWQLRNGIKTNPTVQHLRAIADFSAFPPPT
jgi:hypothetical protein